MRHAQRHTVLTSLLLRFFVSAVPPEKGGHLVTIAATLHGTPTALMRARVVVEKQPASGIGAAAYGGLAALHQEFRSGTGDGGKQPFEAAFAGDKLQEPIPVARDQFVVALGNAQNLVDGLGPGGRETPFVDERRKNGAQGFPQSPQAQEHRVRRLGFVEQQRTKPRGALFGDQAGVHEERNKFLPRQVVGRRRRVREVQCKPASDKRAFRFVGRWHITGATLLDGYSRSGSGCKPRTVKEQENA